MRNVTNDLSKWQKNIFCKWMDYNSIRGFLVWWNEMWFLFPFYSFAGCDGMNEWMDENAKESKEIDISFLSLFHSNLHTILPSFHFIIPSMP